MRSAGTRVEERVVALSRPTRRGQVRRARASGAAMIEAVIVLPVLLLTWASVSFMRERFLARQQSLLAARRCAWAHAVAGCGQPPEGCGTPALAAPDPEQRSAAIMQAARAGDQPLGIDLFDDIPVLGEVLGSLFGAQTGTSALACTPVPWDRERAVIDRAEVVVGCNERPRDVLQAATEVFCENVEVVPCD